MQTIHHRYKRTLGAILVAAFLGAAPACKKNFLGVSDNLAPELTEEKVFSNPTQSRQFYANIFTGIPNSSMMILDGSYTGVTGLQNPWAAISDELKAAHNNVKDVAANGYNPGNAGFGRWTTLYQLIRQANIFMEKGKTIPQTGLSDFISEQEMARMKNVARFFRAYYHYLLFELYGPIPIMGKSVDPSSRDLDFPRNSVDEVVQYISDELDAVIPGLDDVAPRPEERTVPTKGVALAVKAKLLVYAASPL
ncbi:RagB/SusD family nutrient uptake outer membrane protein, partial [Chitinophaga sp.]|uniref:RagB/SusD family nutrient uptake outer membrane protein n=1 Tax=Chitinophaga sp. TaxID=1869181 RepID=UPI002FDD0A08